VNLLRRATIGAPTTKIRRVTPLYKCFTAELEIACALGGRASIACHRALSEAVTFPRHRSPVRFESQDFPL
jgi:hypothetical protein